MIKWCILDFVSSSVIISARWRNSRFLHLAFFKFQSLVVVNLFRLFESFQHFVSIGSESSKTVDSTMRVPQGSVLGLLLFNLYNNYMHKSSAGLIFMNVDDDSTVFSSSNNLLYLFNLVNVELRSLDSWVVVNKLSLILNKMKYSLIML